MDKAERDRLIKELNDQRFRVIITRSDGSQSIFASGLEGYDAISIVIKLNLESGISATYELDDSASHVKACGADPDSRHESN
jgi:hypothetical protein